MLKMVIVSSFMKPYRVMMLSQVKCIKARYRMIELSKYESDMARVREAR